MILEGRKTGKMYDMIIIGAGTAGLSAAIYGVRAGKRVLILEEKNYGGQIINSPEIENYPGIRKISGYEFAKNLYEQATELGAEYRQERVIRVTDYGEMKQVITKTSAEETAYDTKTVILATGVKRRMLGVAREEAFIGAGISYCATCDGMFFRGREVAVVGGGNTALEDAMFLSGYCKKVTLIHRREQFRGEDKLLHHLKEKENVTFLLNKVVIELLGDKMLEGIRLQDVRSLEEQELRVDGVFVAVGQLPDNAAFAELVELDETGYIQAAENCKTKVPGIYTAGDCRTKTVRQLATAASDGAVAALAACEYIG